MTEGARSHHSRFKTGLSKFSPDYKARRDEVLSTRPKESRPTLLQGVRKLLVKLNQMVGLEDTHPEVLYQDPQLSNKVEPRVRVHGNSTPLKVEHEKND